MRLLHFLLIPLLFALTVFVDTMNVMARRLSGHLHLMPMTPRSIIETRRLGLA